MRTSPPAALLFSELHPSKSPFRIHRTAPSCSHAYKGVTRTVNAFARTVDLFSCVQGRDRTGMTALMILSALGVSVIDIVDDYMIAPLAEREYFLISLMKNLRLASPDEAAFAKAFASSLLLRFRYAERCPEEEYGSIHTYLTEAIGFKKCGI